MEAMDEKPGPPKPHPPTDGQRPTPPPNFPGNYMTASKPPPRGAPNEEVEAWAAAYADQIVKAMASPHCCLCCGGLLGFDPDDRIDSENLGLDMCGSCYRRQRDKAQKAAPKPPEGDG
jgi:hypothetical protein